MCPVAATCHVTCIYICTNVARIAKGTKNSNIVSFFCQSSLIVLSNYNVFFLSCRLQSISHPQHPTNTHYTSSWYKQDVSTSRRIQRSMGSRDHSRRLAGGCTVGYPATYTYPATAADHPTFSPSTTAKLDLDNAVHLTGRRAARRAAF
jgi:hypothetical protein